MKKIEMNFLDNKYENQELSFPPFVLRGILPNGLNYFIMEHKKPEDRVLAWLVVPVGSIHEKDTENGIAHFIEHMGFKRTKNFPPGELAGYFQPIGVDIGAGINGITDIDRTVYKIEVPSEKEEYLVNALTLLCDFASFMVFLPEEVEKEKDVILEELRLDSDLSGRIYKAHRHIRFKGSVYEDREILGSEETVRKIRDEDLKNFYSYWYRPDIMALIVVGNCNSCDVEKKIKNIFGSIPSCGKEKPDLHVPFKPHDLYEGIFTDQELKESYVSIYYLRDQSPVRNKGDFRRRLCEELIFEMINMRLYQESYINIHTPLIHGGGCIYRKIKSYNEVRFIGSAREGREMEAFEILLGYIEGIHQNGFNDVEKDETVRQFLEGLRKATERKETRESQDYAVFIMEAFMKEGIFISPDDCYNFACEILPHLKDEELHRSIDYLLQPVNMSVVITCPPDYACNIKEDDILNTLHRVIAKGAIDYKFKELNYSYDYTSIKSGEVLSGKEYRDIKELNFDNGLTVLLKTTDFERGKVYVSYVSKGGKLLESALSPGMFEVAKSAWAEGGTEDLNQIEIERLLRLKSISFNTTGNIVYGLRGHCSEGYLKDLCQWLWQYMKRPGYREEAIAYGIRSAQEHIRQMEQSQEGLIEETENIILLPDNPLSVKASEEKVSTYTDSEDLKKFQILSSVPSNSQLTLVGSFNMEEAIILSSKYFGSLPAGENPFIPSRYFKTEFPSGNTKRIIYKGRENRCLGRIIFPGCMKGENDEIPLDLLAKILSIRYWNDIREKKGLAYSINVENYSPAFIKGYGKFKISFGTDPEKIDYVRDCIMADIDDIKQNGLKPGELHVAKKILLSFYKECSANNSYWLGELYGSALFKLNPEKIFNYKEEILNVKNEDIQSVASRYVDSKNNIFLIAFPEI
jgi:zinc protease